MRTFLTCDLTEEWTHSDPGGGRYAGGRPQGSAGWLPAWRITQWAHTILISELGAVRGHSSSHWKFEKFYVIEKRLESNSGSLPTAGLWETFHPIFAPTPIPQPRRAVSYHMEKRHWGRGCSAFGVGYKFRLAPIHLLFVGEEKRHRKKKNITVPFRVPVSFQHLAKVMHHHWTDVLVGPLHAAQASAPAIQDHRHPDLGVSWQEAAPRPDSVPTSPHGHKSCFGAPRRLGSLPVWPGSWWLLESVVFRLGCHGFPEMLESLGMCGGHAPLVLGSLGSLVQREQCPPCPSHLYTSSQFKRPQSLL